MKVMLLDWKPDDREAAGNRFEDLAGILSGTGHDVTLVYADADGAMPVLTGLNRAIGADPLIRSHRLAERHAGTDVDIVMAPLRGGVAHGLLMVRACGEGLGATRVLLWCDGMSRQRMQGIADQSGMASLVADALERQCLAMADALIGPWTSIDDAFLPAAAIMPRVTAFLPRRKARRGGAGIKEIVFVGPLTPSAGLADFVEAVERLSRAHRFSVAFAGSDGPAQSAIGKEWLGRRAAAWRFPFLVQDRRDYLSAKAYVCRSGQLGFSMVSDWRQPEYFTPEGAVEPRRAGDHSPLANRIEAELDAILGGRSAAVSAPDVSDWPLIMERLALTPLRPAAGAEPAPGVTICVLHFNRPEKLEHALASVPMTTSTLPIELIVIDNASTADGVRARIEAMIAGRADARLLALEHPVPQAAAYNFGLAKARNETVIFLDDDNTFQPDGVERLACGLRRGGFDILVTTLDVFEDLGSAPSASVARMVFLGEAHSAGLFFNGFGDTAMAVRREAFRSIGGFHDPGRGYPCLDWVTLATAQAKGLRIGVLQRPAVRYRRNIHRSAMTANKLNQEEARALVHAAYGSAIDASLISRYAQLLFALDA